MRRPAKTLHAHELYQLSVQNPEFETKFLRRVYRRLRGKEALKLREDFCGTAILATEWVRRVPDGRSQGIDLHLPTLKWGEKHNIAQLGPKAERIQLVNGDVLEASGFSPDLVVAFNFSYFVLKTRELLLRYFRQVRRTLATDGVFVLDIYGGSEAQSHQEERTRQGGFTYVWEQAKYNPITGDYLCYIHFEFPDAPRKSRAFTYDWRLWHLPEVLDTLRDAGFEDPTVYWEGTDEKNGGGNGIFRPSRKGDDSASWVAYIVAPK